MKAKVQGYILRWKSGNDIHLSFFPTQESAFKYVKDKNIFGKVVSLTPDYAKENPRKKESLGPMAQRRGYQNIDRLYLKRLGLKKEMIERLVARQLNGMTLKEAYAAENEKTNPPRRKQSGFSSRLSMNQELQRLKIAIKKGFKDTPYATAKEQEKAALDLLYSIERTKENPPETKIYERIVEIVAVKGPGHNCDAACKRARHTYRHKFKQKSGVYGSADGKKIIIK